MLFIFLLDTEMFNLRPYCGYKIYNTFPKQ